MWELEQRVAKLEGRPAPSRAVRPEAPIAASSIADPLPAHPAPASPVAEVQPVELETRVGLNWLNRIGVITLILGAGFFFKYAVENEWIGAGARVILGLMCGLAAIALGHLLFKRNQKIFAQGMAGLGIALLYLSFYAGIRLYEVIPYTAGFGFMVATTLLACVLADWYDARPVALLGLTGGYLTPWLLSGSQDRPWALFTYILLVNGGALLIARRRNWPSIEAFAFGWTVLMFSGWASQSTLDKRLVGTAFLLVYYAMFVCARWRRVTMGAQLFAAVLAAIVGRGDASGYLTLSLVLAAAGLVVASLRQSKELPTATLGAFWLSYAIFSPTPIDLTFAAITAAFLLFAAWSAWKTTDIAVMGLNGPAYYTAAYLLLDPKYHAWTGLLALLVGALYLGLMARFRRTDERAAVFATGIALGFSVLAVPVQFAGFNITMGWAFEAAVFAWLSRRPGASRFAWAAYAVLMLAIARATAVGTAQGVATVLVNARFLSLVMTAVSALLVAKWTAVREARLLFYAACHLLLLFAGGLEIADWAARKIPAESQQSFDSLSISVMIALYAAILVSAGVFTATAIHRLAGLALIAFVILKLYLYDVWLLGKLYRLVAFITLGGLLVATSFLYSRYRAKIEAWWH